MLHREPRDFIPFYASIEERLRNPETAIRMLQQAVKEGPDRTSHHHTLGTYTVEIKSPQAALRISINKELYSNGQWVNAYPK